VLNLAAGRWVSHRDILDLNGTALAEFPEFVRVEVGSKICNYSVGEAEWVQDVTDQADHSICGELCNWFVLDALCKLVDGTNE
jgi:hypothetical protein